MERKKKLIKGLIVGHKDIGNSLLKALESISGSYENIIYFSNNGLSTKELTDKINFDNYLSKIHTGLWTFHVPRNRHKKKL